MKAVGYIRVSSLEQAIHGVSLDAQRARIADYCRAHGLELIEICTDAGISGRRTNNRPGLKTAMAMACQNKAVLIVYSLSRLSRSVIDCVETVRKIERCGAALVSITENIDTTSAMGKFFFTLMSALGELESEIISERTLAGLNHKRARGEKLGGHVPYGYTARDGRLVPNPAEQIIVGYIVRRTSEGAGIRVVTRELIDAQVPTKRGGRWFPETIRTAVRFDEKRRSHATVQ
jgi:site-specific DNA recombinase